MHGARRLRTCVALALALLLAACGFQLRGRAELPFETLYVSGLDYSPFTGQLKRAIENGSSTRLAEAEGGADAVLELQNESQERAILAVSGGGRVREFQLRYRVSFRVHDGKGHDWLPASEVLLRRDLTYDDTQILAKEAEALMLFKDMQGDAVQQVLRQIQSIRPASRVERG
ncbi:MAG: LPS assembly lipoprotein LptE [Burkholderiales bacterium]|jgi:LPS-assembly lipoprotein|nr:LPS assembly lipoprotein LptE [Burkholderiales bacterium]